MRQVWIVQDSESGLFLFPDDGDVGFTGSLKRAGGFDSYEQAAESAIDHCGNDGADILTFWTDRQVGDMW